MNSNDCAGRVLSFQAMEKCLAAARRVPLPRGGDGFKYGQIPVVCSRIWFESRPNVCDALWGDTAGPMLQPRLWSWVPWKFQLKRLGLTSNVNPKTFALLRLLN